MNVPPLQERSSRYRALVAALAFFVGAHVLGMLTMATLLRPGMDAASFDVAERMRYVASHPWAWRIGWLPWQACALSDLLVNAALLRWLRARPLAAGVGWVWIAIGLNLVSSIPEQWAEAMLVGPFVADASAVSVRQWARDWTLYTQVTGVWAGGGYTVMTAAWMLAVRRACGRGAWRAWAELSMLAAFCLGVAGTWMATVSPDPGPWFMVAAGANAVAFPAVTLWTLGVAGRLGELARLDAPDSADRALALRWPRGRALGWLAPLASDGVRDLMRVLSRVLPYPTLRSDVRDVVYLSWLVPVERLRDRVHASIALHTFDGRVPLSILTYRHGGFGPAFLGPLRRLLPSPAQSNWRLNVAPEQPGAEQDAVLFLGNVIDSPLHVLGSRVGSDGLPAHLPARLRHDRDGSSLHTALEPGGGSAPDLTVEVRETSERAVPSDLRPLGASWEEVVGYLIPQRMAVRAHPAVGLLSRSFIEVGVDPSRVRPARIVGAVASDWLAPLVEGCEPFAFVVPRVDFASTGEAWAPLRAEPAASSLAVERTTK